MQKKWMQILSILLVMVLCLQMLPISTFAETIPIAESSVQENASSPEETTQPLAPDTGADAEEAQIISVKADIVGEDVSGRTEYSKQFRLSNGLHVAAMYNDAVHYEKNGKWEEIDNTLQTKPDGSITNTAGIWSVSFPQQLSGSKAVTVTKDGYTLSFAMAGELRQPGNLEVASLSAEQPETFSVKVDGKNETFSVNAALATSGQIQTIDRSKALAEAEHKEFVLEKNSSQLRYSDIYSNTDVQYDLKGNQLKESIVMESYNSTLRGYRYTLNTDGMIPVLDEEGNITFFDGKKKNVVMVMPAPFLVDAAEVYNYDVKVNLTGSGSTYTLTYLLPQQWLAEADRAWPVILDPVVKAKKATSNVKDTSIGSSGSLGHTKTVMECGVYSSRGKQHMYVMFEELPELPAAAVITSSKVRLYKPANSTKNLSVEVHKVLQPWVDSTLTWGNDTIEYSRFNPIIEDYALVKDKGYYSWDVTDIVRDWYTGQNTGMMFKVDDTTEADLSTASWRQFYTEDYGSTSYMPNLWVYFWDGSGLEDYWNYSVASVGRAGTGYVNNYTGNMTFIRSDIGFGGNRMPVSISHVYNASDNAENLYGAGYGWRTNFNQKVRKYEDNSNYYVWTDGDGTEHYFVKSGTSTYKDEENLGLTLKTNGSGNKKFSITDKIGNVRYFDTNGRFTFQENNQETKSSIAVTYTTDAGNLIDTVTDGVGRVYKYNYTNDRLASIQYLSKGTSALATVSFAYDTNNRLTTVTDLDGKTIAYTYDGTTNLLKTAQDVDGYKLIYEYDNTAANKPIRVTKVSERDGNTQGGELNLEYSFNQTTITDHNNNVQILQFTNWGNLLSTQDGEGRAQFAQYATNGTRDDTEYTAKKNQLTAASKLQNTVAGMLEENGFENFMSFTSNSSAVTATRTTEDSYMGSYSMKLVSTAQANSLTGAYSNVFLVDPGDTVTVSAYIKTTVANACLAFHSNDGVTYNNYPGDPLGVISEWERRELAYTNNTEKVQTVSVYVFVPSAGTTYVDNVQVERSMTASRYNLLANGDFSTYHYNEELDSSGKAKGYELVPSASAWMAPSGQTGHSFVLLKDETTPTALTGLSSGELPQSAPKLTNGVLKIEGSPTAQRKLCQTLPLSGAAGDTYVLAGWAKADSVPLDAYDSRTRQFAIRAVFNNTDGTTTTATAAFNPNADSRINWQYSAVSAEAKKNYNSITVELVYDYNANVAYFDGIQLFREIFDEKYTYDDSNNITAITTLDGETVRYEYSNNNLTKQTLPTGAEVEYTYDNYHNVKTRVDTGTTYVYEYDTYGNNIKTSITEEILILVGDDDFESHLVRMETTSTYSSDGNRLVSTTDSSGKTTTYDYDENTNVLNAVQYPGDTATTRTEFAYDSMYRKISTESDTNTGLSLSAAYTYDANDYLTKIQTGTTSYNFAYGDFGLRSSIKIGNQVLASYSYTNDKNRYLEKLDYGNNDRVQYEYDSQGRVTKQTYEDGATVTYKYNNSGMLAVAVDSATGITTTYYYDSSDRLIKYTETGTNFNHSVEYTYDERSNLTSQREIIGDAEYTTEYTYDDNDRLISVNSNSVESVMSYDTFQRISHKQVAYGGATIKADEFAFYSPPVPETPAAGEGTTPTLTPVYTPTSMQVSSHAIKVGSNESAYKTFHYTYDNNGNILSISDGTNTITYAYDSANQLIRENNPISGKTKTWVYDNSGNIEERKEYAYTTGALGTPTDTVNYEYGNSNWGDLLTKYDGVTITYDNIGNPLSDGTWTYTWQHGRQLASMAKTGTTWNFTYNADGMRTKRQAGTTVYNYVYNGSSLSQMTVGSNHLYFSYDASGMPMAVIYNGTTYYYVTNLQGDVIAILNGSGAAVVEYAYDAWGNPLSTTGSMAATLGAHNPLRYRSYVFDSETGLYYLQSRYYDPKVGRFINVDSFISTNQGLVSNNPFLYCLNNPINCSDDLGSRCVSAYNSNLHGGKKKDNPDPNPLPYESVDSAAKAFAEEIYSSSLYIRHEYSAEIFSRTYNGYTTYGYTYPYAGEPHSVFVIRQIPDGTSRAAYVHTHPNSNYFSNKDIDIANKYGVDAYVVGPNLELLCYDVSAETTRKLGAIVPTTLSANQKDALWWKFRISWNHHIYDGCSFNCGNASWPNS